MRPDHPRTALRPRQVPVVPPDPRPLRGCDAQEAPPVHVVPDAAAPAVVCQGTHLISDTHLISSHRISSHLIASHRISSQVLISSQTPLEGLSDPSIPSASIVLQVSRPSTYVLPAPYLPTPCLPTSHPAPSHPRPGSHPRPQQWRNSQATSSKMGWTAGDSRKCSNT